MAETGRAFRSLKLVFLKRLERRWAAAQGVVSGDPVKDMDAAVVQQGGLGHGPFGTGTVSFIPLG